LIASYVLQGTFDQRVIQTLMLPDGFVPKECEFWDYKTTTNSDAVSKAKTVLQAVSFYNAYGGYIIYGVAQGAKKGAYSPLSLEAEIVNEQQLKALIQDYTGEATDISYRELQVPCDRRDTLFGILHIPKRSNKTPPVSFQKNGPDVKPRDPLFRAGEVYVRLQDNCIPAKDKKSWQFLFGSRECEEGVKDQLRLSTVRESILDHNLPDRNLICSRFFGRDDIFERLWLWLSDEFSRTRVLAGEGGKGKTSIAYEFSQEICRTKPYDLQRVFWVTAKSKQFAGLRNEYVETPETNFHDLQSLLHGLCSGYAILEQELENASVSLLKKRLQEALKVFPSLIVIDDVDSIPELDEQKRILEMALQVSAGTSSRFLLTTRMNLTSSSDVCIPVSGLHEDEHRLYLNYLNETIGGPRITTPDAELLWKTTEGSPLFTESVFRLYRLGMPLNRAIKEWKGKLGEEVRMAALHREISKLSLESRRVLLACAYMGEAATVELKQVTGYDDVRMTTCIAELQSLFLLAAPEFIREIPRFKVPSNTARLVVEREKELVSDPAGLKKTISNLRARNRVKRVNRVGEAIAQGNALLREKRFDEAIKTVEAVGNRYGDNPDLLLMWGRCYFEKSKEYNNERSYNAEARRLFKKAYDLGQRRDLLYEMWHQSELDVDHPNGALEVSDAAIKDGIGARSEWVLRRMKAMYTVSWRHAKAQNVREAQDGFGQCVDDIRRAIGKGEVSQFQESERIRS